MLLRLYIIPFCALNLEEIRWKRSQATSGLFKEDRQDIKKAFHLQVDTILITSSDSG